MSYNEVSKDFAGFWVTAAKIVWVASGARFLLLKGFNDSKNQMIRSIWLKIGMS